MTKPTFTLLPRDPTFEEVLAFFTALTGREPTEEEVREAKEVWDGLHADES